MNTTELIEKNKTDCVKIFKGAPDIDSIYSLSKNYKNTIEEILLINNLEVKFTDEIYISIDEAHNKYGIDNNKKPVHKKGWRLPYIKEFKEIIRCNYIKDKLFGKFHVLDTASSLNLIYKDSDNVFFAPKNQYITSALNKNDMGYIILVRNIKR